MSQASAQKKRPPAHSRRRLVIPAWEDTDFTSYAMGGKGHGIAQLMALRLPTPPAIIISTSLARSYQETGQLPKRFYEQLGRELAALERKTGKRFGDPVNPLLVSVRSGAMISMPGMMETVLNVGLTRAVSNTICAHFGKQFVKDCKRHLGEGLGLHWIALECSQDAGSQLGRAILRVLDSWNSPRAQAYRREHGIDNRLGTAIVIQVMVFGNASQGESGTGVVMSHDPETAEPGLFGNYLPRAQGHDLVSGTTTPDPIATFVAQHPVLANELKVALVRLESEVGWPVEVEFTVENGTLYFLQFRKAKLSPEATVVHLVRQKHAGRMNKDEVVVAVPEWMVDSLSQRRELAIDPRLFPDDIELIGTGTGVTKMPAVGYVASSDADVILCKQEGVPYILVRRETTPDDFELMIGAAGIITQEGGQTCHAAVVARHQGIPAVIGVGEEVFAKLLNHPTRLFFVTIDPATGSIWSGGVPMQERRQRKEVDLFLRWRQTGKLVIDPKFCLEKFATNTALNDFYLAEAMLVECPDEAFKAKIRTIHRQLTARTSAVFSTYLALAVASEVTYALQRSAAFGYVVNPNHKLPKDVVTAFDQLCKDFTLQHRDSWDGLTAPVIAYELARVSASRVCDFFAICRRVFAKGSWGGNYGGWAWANIASVGELYWSGDISAETFVDRVFDLQHNSGTVLNKHEMVYDISRGHFLNYQLDTKRKALPVAKKWVAMRALHTEVNPELLALFEEGKKKGVWKS